MMHWYTSLYVARISADYSLMVPKFLKYREQTKNYWIDIFLLLLPIIRSLSTTWAYIFISLYFLYFATTHKKKALNNIGGVFVVLLCGLAFAVLVAIIEFCYKSRKENFNDPLNLLHSKSSLCAELKEELCFSLNCRNANHQRQAFKRHNICHQCQASKNLYLESKSQQTNMINDVM